MKPMTANPLKSDLYVWPEAPLASYYLPVITLLKRKNQTDSEGIS
jgi:hypothetical protein